MRKVILDATTFAQLTDEDPKQELKYLVDGEGDIKEARRKKITNEARIEKTCKGYAAKIIKKNQ